jgi:hypothetical protein
VTTSRSALTIVLCIAASPAGPVPTPMLATAVTRDGTAVFYRERDGRLVEEKRSAAPFAARLGMAWLTRVPGLVYLVRIDLAREEALRQAPQMQSSPARHERLALSASAEPWDAIPAEGNRRALLEGVYRADPTSLRLSLAPGRWLSLRLPQSLDTPFRSKPYTSSQAVFSFGEHGLLCRTRGGWSLHRADGTLEAWFSTEGISVGWWDAPVFWEDPLSTRPSAFFVKARTGPGGADYRLDMDKMRLVPARVGEIGDP